MIQTNAVHPQIPTITCTSSNVLQTVLQAFAQARTHASRVSSLLSVRELPHAPHATLTAVPFLFQPQVPGLSMWYGPDTYMGENLHTLLSRLAAMDDAQVAAVHPQHTAATIRDLLPRFHYFKQVSQQEEEEEEEVGFILGLTNLVRLYDMTRPFPPLLACTPPRRQGNCIVHHLFGHDVVQRVKAHYGDAFHTAHLEVSE